MRTEPHEHNHGIYTQVHQIKDTVPSVDTKQLISIESSTVIPSQGTMSSHDEEDQVPVASSSAATYNDATVAAVFQAVEQLTCVFGFDAQVAQAAVEAVGTDITTAYNYILDSGVEDKGGPIVPISNCPHVPHHVKVTPPQLPSPNHAHCHVPDGSSAQGKAKGEVMEDGRCPSGENWVCLECGVVRCSRYINGHGIAHYQDSLKNDPGEDGAGHCIAASLADLSVWCHACNGYLRHPDLDPLVKKLEELKFETEEDATKTSQEEDLAAASTRTNYSDSSSDVDLDDMGYEEEVLVYPFGSLPANLEDVAQFIKSDNCQSIVVLSGAGMSVASGIPDFRSVGGLYDTLKPEQLTATEAEREAIRADPTYALEQGLFIQNPLPCLEIIRPFIMGTQKEQWKATIAHRFVELLHHKTHKLTRLYTQNIDGLEGQCHLLPREKVVAVHGSMDRAECALCHTTTDYNDFCKLVQENIKDITGQDPAAPKSSTLIPCHVCGHAAVKPSVVLFRSSLPQDFFDRVPQDIPHVDLLIVIGTSLAVAPANTLVFRIPPTALRVVVNDEPVGWRLGIEYGSQAKRDFFAQGHCDAVMLDLIEHLGWLEDIAPLVDHLPEESAKRVRDRMSSDESISKQQGMMNTSE